MKKNTFLFAFFALFIWQINAQTIIIGASTGTSNGNSCDPIDGYFNSFRYQTVYTAAELSASLVAGDNITGLGFSISEDYGGGDLLGYTIKLGHTTAANSTIHDTSPTIEVKNFDYNPVETAEGVYDMINFDTNFAWNGVDNVLIDICTDGENPFTSGSFGGVRVANSTNGARYDRVDGDIMCNENTTDLSQVRPSIQFSYTAGSVPNCTTLTNPVNGATDVSLDGNITWNTSTDATGYNLTVGTTTGGDDVLTTTDVGDVTTYNIGTLTEGLTYFVSVIPYNFTGDATGCTEESFTTLINGILISDGSVTACSGDFYDTGGPNANFQNNEDYTLVVTPDAANKVLQVTFSAFNCGGSSADYLKIYDGLDNTATLLVDSNISGDAAMFASFTATNVDGALTFVFHSSSAVSNPGWEASFSCATVSVADAIIDGFSMYPNPVLNTLTISATHNIDAVRIYNVLGQEVIKRTPSATQTQINMALLPKGAYVVKVYAKNQVGAYNLLKQ